VHGIGDPRYGPILETHENSKLVAGRIVQFLTIRDENHSDLNDSDGWRDKPAVWLAT